MTYEPHELHFLMLLFVIFAVWWSHDMKKTMLKFSEILLCSIEESFETTWGICIFISFFFFKWMIPAGRKLQRLREFVMASQVKSLTSLKSMFCRDLLCTMIRVNVENGWRVGLRFSPAALWLDNSPFWPLIG